MNPQLTNRLLHRDGFSSPAMVRALIEATTATTGRPTRKHRKHTIGWADYIAGLIVLAALAAFLGASL